MKQLATMQRHLWIAILFLIGLCMWSGSTRAEMASPQLVPISGNSVYQLKATLFDQSGRAFQLASLRGQPVLISMFYNSCQFVCPMLIDTLRATEESLTPDQRKHIAIVLVTFDPARDDVPALKAIAAKRELDPAHWTLARTDAASVRKLAAVLGIQYRQLASGEFNHSTALILLDADGRIVGKTAKIGALDPAFVTLMKTLVKKATDTIILGEHK